MKHIVSQHKHNPSAHKFVQLSIQCLFSLLHVCSLFFPLLVGLVPQPLGRLVPQPLGRLSSNAAVGISVLQDSSSYWDSSYRLVESGPGDYSYSLPLT